MIAVLKINGNSPVRKEWFTTTVNVGSIASKHSKNSDVGIASSSQVFEAHWCIIFLNQLSEIGVKLLNEQPENWLSWAYGKSWSAIDRTFIKMISNCLSLVREKIWEQFWKFFKMFYWQQCLAMPCNQLVCDAKKLLDVWAFCNFSTVICTFCIVNNSCYSFF